MFASLNALLLALLISHVPFSLGVYFWSGLVWFAWYLYGRYRLRSMPVHRPLAAERPAAQIL
jgi:hypothetical protein